tara:strand:+ start:3795 stop:4688 length:894 start_codon:yes stop_codon:yes gene_type:complete
MAGITTTDALADSIPTMVQSARIVREHTGVMTNIVDRKTLGKGMGTTWSEVDFAALSAQGVTATTDLEGNPQVLVDSTLGLKPTIVGIHVLVTDAVAEKISGNAAQIAKSAVLSQNAIQRKKDEDGLAVYASATDILGTANTAISQGILAAGSVAVSGALAEPTTDTKYIVLHPFMVHDIYTELVSTPLVASGAEQMLAGESASVFRQGFRGMVNGAMLFEDGNLAINAAKDATGGVHAKEGIILVQGMSPRVEPQRRPNIGGGATSLYHYDDYVWGERSTGNWVKGVIGDATEPTS